MSVESSRAVFLSYASQDAEAARRICESLRAAGIEVWFDQSELRGGDAWDQKIRRQIRECALFVPVISANTQDRLEGYFRLEWKLAEDRSHLMAKGKPFIVPVTTDATSERRAEVPDSFLAVQWTRLSGAEVPQEFGARLRALLGPPEIETGRSRSAQRDEDVARGQTAARRHSMPLWVWVTVLAVGLGIAALFALRRVAKETKSARTDSKLENTGLDPSRQPKADQRFLAVLPFANLTDDRDNTTGFAGGMHDGVIDALGKVAALTVIGRTSVLPYADPKQRDLKKIAAVLGISTVVEGTVGIAGNSVRVTVELVDAQTSRRLWGKAYVQDLTDVFAIQAAIAQDVAARLDATLTAGERTLLARRPTENTRAHELYLEAKLRHHDLTISVPLQEWESATTVLDEAVTADPAFFQAFALLSRIHSQIKGYPTLDPTPARREQLARRALTAAQRLAPAAPETRLAEGRFALSCEKDPAKVLIICKPLLLELPNDDDLIFLIGLAQRMLVRDEEAVTSFRRAFALNPFDVNKATNFITALLSCRRFAEAVEIGGRYSGASPKYDAIVKHTAYARFELDGDRARLARSLRENPFRRFDPEGTRGKYEAALITGDLAEAARLLSGDDQRAFNLNDHTEPVALHRALVAFILGQQEASATHATVATDYYLRLSTPSQSRERGWARVGLAMAAVCGGRNAEARSLLAEVGREFESDLTIQNELGRIYALLGDRDDALEILRRLMTGPNSFHIFSMPRLIRIDPCWSRLADDARFDETLKAAKPL
jgi:TolB-like protein